MVFLIFLKNTNRRNAIDVSFGRYQQHDSQKRVLLFELRIVDDTTSNFEFDHQFKLNFSEITGHTNTECGIIYHYTEVDVIMGLMTS